MKSLLYCTPSLKTLHFASNVPLPPETLSRIISNAPKTLKKLSLVATPAHDRGQLQPQPGNAYVVDHITYATTGAIRGLKSLPRLEDLEIDTTWLLPTTAQWSKRIFPCLLNYLPRSLRYLGLWLGDDKRFDRLESDLFYAFDSVSSTSPVPSHDIRSANLSYRI